MLSQDNVLSELPKAFKIINDGTRNNTEVPVAKDDSKIWLVRPTHNSSH